MGARQKLNSFYFFACSIIAAVAGLVFQSWSIFVIGLVVGLVLKFHDGGIRLRSRRQRDSECSTKDRGRRPSI
jgi:hypothetical protein